MSIPLGGWLGAYRVYIAPSTQTIVIFFLKRKMAKIGLHLVGCY